MSHENDVPSGIKGRYLAFAEWRTGTVKRARPMRRSVGYFRQTRNRSLIWMIVMRGYYLSCPPTVKECIREVTCSTGTVRKIILDAQVKGYIKVQQASDDRRKRLVWPSRQCVLEYEEHVDILFRIPEFLKDATRADRKVSKQKR